MLKKLSCIFFLNLSVSMGFAQNEIPKQYVDHDGKPVNEKYAAYYLETYKIKDADTYWQRKLYYNDTMPAAIASVGRCRDREGQIKEGSFVFYYKNGMKMSEGDYVNNSKEGEWEEWAQKGNLKALNHYRNGKMVGRNISWYQKGNMSDSTMLDENGNGKSLAFYPSGAKQSEGEYISGSRNGKWMYYYLDVKNQKSIEVTYEMDSVKNYTCYTETGELQKKDCVFEREANFRTGDEGWRKYLVKKLTAKVPVYTKLLKANESYTVIVRFIVGMDGSIEDVKIEKKGRMELDEIAWDIIQDSPKWIPAV